MDGMDGVKCTRDICEGTREIRNRDFKLEFLTRLPENGGTGSRSDKGLVMEEAKQEPVANGRQVGREASVGGPEEGSRDRENVFPGKVENTRHLSDIKATRERSTGSSGSSSSNWSEIAAEIVMGLKEKIGKCMGGLNKEKQTGHLHWEQQQAGPDLGLQ